MGITKENCGEEEYHLGFTFGKTNIWDSLIGIKPQEDCLLWKNGRSAVGGRRPAIGGRRSGGADCFWRSALGGRQSSLAVGGRVENSAVGAHHSSPKRRSLAVGYSETDWKSSVLSSFEILWMALRSQLLLSNFRRRYARLLLCGRCSAGSQNFEIFWGQIACSNFLGGWADCFLNHSY